MELFINALKSILRHIVIGAAAQRDGAVGVTATGGQIPIRHDAVCRYSVIRVAPFLDAALEGGLKRNIVCYLEPVQRTIARGI